MKIISSKNSSVQHWRCQPLRQPLASHQSYILDLTRREMICSPFERRESQVVFDYPEEKLARHKKFWSHLPYWSSWIPSNSSLFTNCNLGVARDLERTLLRLSLTPLVDINLLMVWQIDFMWLLDIFTIFKISHCIVPDLKQQDHNWSLSFSDYSRLLTKLNQKIHRCVPL